MKEKKLDLQMGYLSMWVHAVKEAVPEPPSWVALKDQDKENSSQKAEFLAMYLVIYLM